MKCYLWSADCTKTLAVFDAIPVCGDFCDTCGDCLHCYDGDGCMVNGEWDSDGAHYWVIYPEDIPEFLEKHAVSPIAAAKVIAVSGQPPPVPSVGWVEFVGGPADGDRRQLPDMPPTYRVVKIEQTCALDIDAMTATVPCHKVEYQRRWYRGWVMNNYDWVWAEWFLYVLPGVEPYPMMEGNMP
jgi:hypothetical protein